LGGRTKRLTVRKGCWAAGRRTGKNSILKSLANKKFLEGMKRFPAKKRESKKGGIKKTFRGAAEGQRVEWGARDAVEEKKKGRSGEGARNRKNGQNLRRSFRTRKGKGGNFKNSGA